VVCGVLAVRTETEWERAPERDEERDEEREVEVEGVGVACRAGAADHGPRGRAHY